MYYNYNYKKEEKWEFTYAVVKDGVETIKKCYPKSKEQIEKNKQTCEEKGMRFIGCKKLYPFSSEKNQHNFELVRNVCFNTIRDMQNGDIEYDEAEIDRLYDLKEKADKYFELPLPVAWLPWEELKEAKDICTMAVEHRVAKCVEHGLYDYIQYC